MLNDFPEIVITQLRRLGTTKAYRLVVVRLILICFFCSSCTLHTTVNQHFNNVYVPLENINDLYSDLQLGPSYFAGRTTIRVFAPRAARINLVIHESNQDMAPEEVSMARNRDGIWSASKLGRMEGTLYGFRIWSQADQRENRQPNTIISDPYARMVTSPPWDSSSTWSQITREEPDQHKSRHIINTPADAIIYEMNIRDATVHPSAEAEHAGTFPGLAEHDSAVVISHLRALGINTVLLQPVFEGSDFSPRSSSSGEGTTHYMAPERSCLASTGDNLTTQFGDMVRTFHANGIAVFLDFPLHIASPANLSPFCSIDRQYYLQATDDGYTLNIDRPMVKKLLADAVRHWVREYHIDGYRILRGSTLDLEALTTIKHALHEEYPDVALIIEGDENDPSSNELLADLGYAVMNLQFRHGVLGISPHEEGFIFGGWSGRNSPASVERYLLGSPRWLGGPFINAGQSVNFLSTYNTPAVGDFIRLSRGPVDPRAALVEPGSSGSADRKGLAFHRLAALYLLVSQGAVSIRAGQEFAHSQVSAVTQAMPGKPDDSEDVSPARDGSENHLNWDLRTLNSSLVDYYRGLIEIRRAYPAFRQADARRISLFPGKTDLGLAMLIPGEASTDNNDFFVIINGNPTQADEFALPGGAHWTAIATWSKAGTEPLVAGLSGVISIPPSAGMILRR